MYKDTENLEFGLGCCAFSSKEETPFITKNLSQFIGCFAMLFKIIPLLPIFNAYLHFARNLPIFSLKTKPQKTMATVILKDGKKKQKFELDDTQFKYLSKFLESIREEEEEHPVLKDIREGLEYVKEIKKGNKKGRPLQELLDEIEDE